MVYAISASSEFHTYNDFFKQGRQSGTLGRRTITSNNASATKAVYLSPFDAIILSFKNLADGWNGDQTKAIPSLVIKNASMMLQNVPKDGLKIFPTGRESIQFEYDNGEKSLEIEIFADRFEVALFDDIELIFDETQRLTELEKIEQYLTKLHES
ncbi:MAG: hypothetical protein WCY78_01535 [Sphaerochaetaceae bacterium]